jgi:hypothetical protein
MLRSSLRSFVLTLTRDNGSEVEKCQKKVCKRCDDAFRSKGRVASALYHRSCTLCDRLSAPPYRLSDGCIVPAGGSGNGEGITTRGIGVAALVAGARAI